MVELAFGIVGFALELGLWLASLAVVLWAGLCLILLLAGLVGGVCALEARWRP